MPRFDGTGPLSNGPVTGRGMGPCVAGYGLGRLGYPAGRGLSRGRSLGWRSSAGLFSYLPQLTKKEEEGLLKEEAAVLEEDLASIKQRLAQLKAKT